MKATNVKPSMGYEDLQKLAKRQKWSIRALAALLVIICTGIAWLIAYKAAESFWLKTIVISAVDVHIKRAQAAELKPSEKPKAYTIPQIVDAVHILESSGGVKDGCIAKGKINGFGYAQTGSGKVWNCYKNYAEVRKLVEQWFTEKVPALGLSTALCYYNTGHQEKDCTYYRHFLQVIES